MCRNFRRLYVRNPRNSVTNYLFSYETLWRQPHEKMWRATIIQSGFVKLERVFLPYAQDAADVTVCEHLKEQKFSDYSLTEGGSPVSQQACQSRARDGREERVSSQAPKT